MDALWLQTAALYVAEALGCAALAGSRRRLRLLHADVSERSWRALAAITLAALSVRALAPPEQPTWLVGWTFIEQARGTLLDHRGGYCLDGEPGACRAHYPFYTGGYPFVLALAFSLLGASEAAARAVGVACSALSVPLLFLLAQALLRREGPALLAALVLALLPLHAAHAPLVHSEGPCVAAELGALWAWAAWRRLGGRWPALLWSAASAVAVQLRPEEPFLLLAMALLAPLARASRGRPLVPAREALLGLALVLPQLAIMPTVVESLDFEGAWAPQGDGLLRHFSPRFALQNRGYLVMWLNAWYLPLIVPALAALALAARPRHPAAIPLALWLGARLSIYLLHSYPYHPRYTLLCSAPLCLLAALGAERLSSGPGGGRRPLVAAALALSLLAYLPYVRAPGYGIEGITDAQREGLQLVHHGLVPLALAGLAAISADRRARVVALATLGFAAFALPRVARLGIESVGTTQEVREVIEFEEGIAGTMRAGDLGGCAVVTERPFAVTWLWRAPALHIGLLDEAVRRARSGECLYYYETAACAEPLCQAIHADPRLRLEPVLERSLPQDTRRLAVASWAGDATVYRVTAAGG